MRVRDAVLLVRRNLWRRPLRTGLTVLGVALSVMLFVGVESLAAGMDDALTSGEKATTLMVYRKNRYCPQTSYLPERYTEEIANVSGVASVLPVKVFLNNCRTNLDMITFQGAPVDRLLATRHLTILDGSQERFREERDSALVGLDFANRRKLAVGDQFRFGDINVKVAGVFQSADPIENGLVLTHLEYLQRAGPINRLGTVTQYEVRIDEASRAREIAQAIDARFASAEEPTDTRLMASFLERATRDLQEILRFGRLFGVACVVVVIIVLGNTIAMAVSERRREMGTLRAIGFRGRHLAISVLLESGAIAILGGALGVAAITLLLRMTGVAIGVEGVQVAFRPTGWVIGTGMAMSLVGALLAGAVPAWMAARTNVLTVLRGGH